MTTGRQTPSSAGCCRAELERHPGQCKEGKWLLLSSRGTWLLFAGFAVHLRRPVRQQLRAHEWKGSICESPGRDHFEVLQSAVPAARPGAGPLPKGNAIPQTEED